MHTVLLSALALAAPALGPGKHLLSLQWIDGAGICEMVARDDGTLRLEGKHTGKNGDFVEVSGDLEDFKPESFVLLGKIVTKVSHIAGGKACPREGRFTFRATGTRKYWRLLEKNNPCENVVDYVDIHFASSR